MPYHVGYATSSRAACKGPKPCNGTKILKGELRLGTLVEIQGSQTFQWRHWGCVTPKIIRNIQDRDGITDAIDLSGYEELLPVDRARITRAFVLGEVAPQDMTESLRGKEEPAAAEAAQQQATVAAIPSPASQPPAKKRGRPSKASLEAAAAAAAPVAPNGVGISAAAPPSSIQKKPGRPPKNTAAQPPAPVVVAPAALPAAAPSAPATKKRGRPPKNVEASFAAAAIPAAPAPTAAEAPQLKKRGRPPKAQTATAQPLVPVQQPFAPAPVAPTAPGLASPKKRGRPPKNTVAPISAHEAERAAPASAPAAAAPSVPSGRKRGRPSKASLAEAAAAAAAAEAWPVAPSLDSYPVSSHGSALGAYQPPAPTTAYDTPSPKKRGRPRKDASVAQASPAVTAPSYPPQLVYMAAPTPTVLVAPQAAPAKKRGRPRKEVNSVAASGASLSQVASGPPMPLQPASQAAAAAPNSGKKRGRPPKEKVDEQLPVPVKRPRGRPKKSDAVATTPAHSLAHAAPAVTTPRAVAPGADVPAKRSRGRPRKDAQA